ncbi:MAG: gp58-like family protein, partial [Prevotellaceae bacterium]|nr:gp58-like family protein [Prevotellaceae bacterium]
MAKELIARGQATIITQTDACTIYLSRQNYVVSTDKDGKILTAVTTNTVISALKGTEAVTPTIGTLPTVAGCTLSKSGTTVTIVFNTGTSLAENGTIDIPVTVDGKSFTVSFAYAKAKTGATGVDANLLDWVSDWNTNKTVIDNNSVITPKIFAGVKNSNGTLTGVALGRFSLSTMNASGQVATETIDGIYGFKDGYRTFFVDNGGNAQLGCGNQYIKFNAATGKVEFGSDVSLNWIGATYIDAGGIFTGTLSANTVNAININASQITAGTINAARIDVASLKASLITAANIEALTLSVNKGTIGGWTMDADSIFRGTKNNTSGACTAASGAMTIGSNGIRGYKWRLDATGAGAVAGGNISWDASGNVSFASSVSLNWTTPINNLTTALGGSSYPKMTYISSTGIYTGTLTATQVNAVSIDAGSIKTGTLSADRIATGSIYADKLNAASLKTNIINTAYINGLYCTFDRGTIGSWYIEGDNLNCDYIRLGRLIESYPNWISGFGIQMLSPYSMEECFCLSTTGGGDIYNHIAGWMFDEYCIWKNNVALYEDGSIINYNGSWYLNNDGSGSLAGGNIYWDSRGRVSFSSSVSLNWTTPINNLTTALGGSSYPKMTYISS